jgi:hypothetical protein
VLFRLSRPAFGFGRSPRDIERRTYSFDEKLLVALRNPADLAGPISGLAENVMRDITSLGSFAFVVIRRAVIGYLAIDGAQPPCSFWLPRVALC